MTISELHTAFKIELDKSNNLSYPSFEPNEIDYWLNRGQRDLFRDILHGTGHNPININVAAFKEDLVNKFAVTSTLNTTDDVKVPNRAYADLPSDFSEDIGTLVIADSNVNQVYTADRLKYREAIGFIETPINKPWIPSPVYYIQDNKLYYIYDGDNSSFNPGTDTVELSYYRYPVDVSLSTGTTSELPEGLHDYLVANSANLALDNIESPRIQTNTQILNDTI